MTGVTHIDKDIYALALRYFRRRAHANDAEDLAHDTLARFYRVQKGHENPRALLLHAAFCVMTDHIRQRTLRAAVDLRDYSWEYSVERDPAELVEAEDFARFVLNKLPPRNREIIFAMKGMGYTGCECQRRFDITENTVENHWRDAKVYLSGVEA